MTIIYSAARLIYGLSGDTKPTTNIPTDSIFFETDTRRYFVYDGTYWNTISHAETVDRRKYGEWHGVGTGGASGVLAANLTSIAVGTGSNTAASDSTDGNYITHDTGATINSLAGVRTTARKFTRINNCYFKAKITTGASVANTRIFCGFVNSASAPVSASDPLNAVEGVALWYDSAVNANWRRLHNDSAGASVSDDTTLAVATSTGYTVEIFAVTDSKFVFNFNGTYTDISTDIPASTTVIGLWIYIENTLGSSRTIKANYFSARSDK